MSEPEWIAPELAHLVLREQLRRHGGPAGLRDAGRLQAALDRPCNLFAYKGASLFRLAASYAHGLASGHPFVEGNKRTSFVISATFLALNGIHVAASANDVHATWTRLASGAIDEEALAAWFEARDAGAV